MIHAMSLVVGKGTLCKGESVASNAVIHLAGAMADVSPGANQALQTVRRSGTIATVHMSACRSDKEKVESNTRRVTTKHRKNELIVAGSSSGSSWQLRRAES